MNMGQWSASQEPSQQSQCRFKPESHICRKTLSGDLCVFQVLAISNGGKLVAGTLEMAPALQNGADAWSGQAVVCDVWKDDIIFVR